MLFFLSELLNDYWKRFFIFVFDRSFKRNALIDSDHLQFNQLEFYSNFKKERSTIWDKNEWFLTCVKCGGDPRNGKCDMILSPAIMDRRSRFSVSIINSFNFVVLNSVRYGKFVLNRRLYFSWVYALLLSLKLLFWFCFVFLWNNFFFSNFKTKFRF